jgi:N-acetyl-alpha-D-glucosaminyl L-malate synthase BshA
LRVALLCHACLGGSSRVATRLGYALERLGHAVSLISASQPPAPAKELSAIRLEPLDTGGDRRWTTVIEPTWDSWRLAALERHVETVIRRDRVHVVHYHYAWPFAHIVPRLKARLGSAAPVFVGTLHGTDVMHPPTDASVGALRATDVLTTVSQTYAQHALERLALTDPPLVIPNFVDLDDFTSSIDFTHASARRAKPRLVHVSNYRQVKNPEGVASIFLALRKRIPAELWLVGDGPGLHALTTTLGQAGVGADVRVLGYRPDIGQVLAQCDLLLMTSWEESFCLAALEAMTCGLSVVATSVGGLTELVEHGRTAMLYEPGDYPEGARLALQVLTDHDLRLQMRQFAARHARTFSAGSIVRRYEALYLSGCSSRDSLQEPLAIEAV